MRPLGEEPALWLEDLEGTWERGGRPFVRHLCDLSQIGSRRKNIIAAGKYQSRCRACFVDHAIKRGKQTFTDAGGPRAYFGDPAAASAEEGRRTIEVLGGILEEAVLAELKA